MVDLCLAGVPGHWSVIRAELGEEGPDDGEDLRTSSSPYVAAMPILPEFLRNSLHMAYHREERLRVRWVLTGTLINTLDHVRAPRLLARHVIIIYDRSRCLGRRRWQRTVGRRESPLVGILLWCHDRRRDGRRGARDNRWQAS